jgi:glycosyltransferase involved in cell wall biosynthesis
MSKASPRSIVFVQYAGDYAKTYRSLLLGGAETYYAQRYSIEAVAALVSPNTAVATICCTADSSEDAVLSNGVRIINIKAGDSVDERVVWQAVQACAPTHLCLRTPLTGVLRQALADESIKTVLLTLADSFNGRDFRSRFQYWRLRHLLNHPKVTAVGNHGVNASESLRRIGVDARRIIPWDWPHDVTPHQSAAKEARTDSVWNILFVGALAETKGIGDVMRAVRALKDRGTTIRLSYAGGGDSERFAALAVTLDIADQVNYLGLVPHSAVVPLMKDADLIIVPSRHEYPEGFPMTIYEALSSRTPIVASDHPMYSRHLRDTRSALIYPAGDPQALAAAIENLRSDPDLYRALSNASATAWDKLQLPMTWSALIHSWLDQLPGEEPGLARYSLAQRETSSI